MEAHVIWWHKYEKTDHEAILYEQHSDQAKNTYGFIEATKQLKNHMAFENFNKNHHTQACNIDEQGRAKKNFLWISFLAG